MEERRGRMEERVEEEREGGWRRGLMEEWTGRWGHTGPWRSAGRKNGAIEPKPHREPDLRQRPPPARVSMETTAEWRLSAAAIDFCTVAAACSPGSAAQAHTHTHRRTDIHMHIHTHTGHCGPRTNTHAHTQIHTQIHTRTNAHTKMHTHTHTHWPLLVQVAHTHRSHI